MRAIRILEAALTEAAEAAAWYELQRPGLGEEFAAAIQAGFDLIEADNAPLTPMYGESGALGVRRLVLQRFPFDIIVSDRNGERLVLAIAHHARRPGYWRTRSGS